MFIGRFWGKNLSSHLRNVGEMLEEVQKMQEISLEDVRFLG